MDIKHEQNLTPRLKSLNATQNSITSLSNWIQFHIKKAAESVQIWNKEIVIADPKQRLNFIYVANDVLQNSKKKSSKFVEAFAKVLPDTFRTVLPSMPQDDVARVQRTVKIWEERSIFPSDFCQNLLGIVNDVRNGTISSSSRSILQKQALPQSPSTGSSSSTVVSLGNSDSWNPSHLNLEAILAETNVSNLDDKNYHELQALKVDFEKKLNQVLEIQEKVGKESENIDDEISKLQNQIEQLKRKKAEIQDDRKLWGNGSIQIQNFVTKIDVELSRRPASPTPSTTSNYSNLYMSSYDPVSMPNKRGYSDFASMSSDSSTSDVVAPFNKRPKYETLAPAGSRNNEYSDNEYLKFFFDENK